VLQGIDHARFRFRHLLVECRDLPRMDAFSASHGDRHLEQPSEHDHLFVDAGRSPTSA